jgi:hypothetical protein
MGGLARPVGRWTDPCAVAFVEITALRLEGFSRGASGKYASLSRRVGVAGAPECGARSEPGNRGAAIRHCFRANSERALASWPPMRMESQTAQSISLVAPTLYARPPSPTTLGILISMKARMGEARVTAGRGVGALRIDPPADGSGQAAQFRAHLRTGITLARSWRATPFAVEDWARPVVGILMSGTSRS